MLSSLMPLSQDGVVCAMCIWGVGVGLARVVPHFASWYAISLHVMSMCTVTFCFVIMYVDHLIWLVMAEMSSLS